MNEINWELVPVWIQAIGSLGGVVALYFLWQTLKAQNKTLKEQQKLTDLEHRRYLESIMPILELSKNDSILDNSVLEFNLCVDKNYLFNLIIETTFAGISDFDDVKKVTQNFPIGSVIVFRLNLRLYEDYKTNKGGLFFYSILFRFKDRLGNWYCQRFFFNGLDDFYLEPPTLFGERLTLTTQSLKY